MPRLSVDIDLTYLPIGDREGSLKTIADSLSKIRENIIRSFPKLQVVHKEETAKLLINNKEAAVKIEVNLIKRGCYTGGVIMNLCEKAQTEFNRFCEIKVVEKGHLYGGKICAALDRQHPRDLFDIRQMMMTEPFSTVIVKGFIFYLISSNRPIAKMIRPNLLDQRGVLDKQFSGMTEIPFTYEDFEETRGQLIHQVNQFLTPEDKIFLRSIEAGIPLWEIYDFSMFPAVQWKLLHVNKFKKESPKKHATQMEVLSQLLKIIECSS